jgi:hypothetical protein
MRRLIGAALGLLFVPLLMTGCQQKVAAPAASPFILTASVQDLMLSMVDPSADALWESVSIVTNAAGTETKQPKTDAEWLELRHRAITLIEATNLLAMQGRRVVHEGGKLEGEGTAGSLTALQVQALVDGDHGSFVTFAHGLHASAVTALKAIDAKDAIALLEVGGVIDAACEACHKKYWYPETPPK